ncbi:hypothetical protein RhiXN_05254 [Rhizoctonia solani]|uniref:Uncharacterized protein n=1 Tax=Rhizoctonia solani TaxID=456999 RepID=A0A8H8NS60_9AGAM|nr:uncharacterized protein RhiXN_05254 [Rhizoctonia solani]QRW17252.1 hypothetical protein RhiXN_05254 [Rhizoctonia solani]
MSNTPRHTMFPSSPAGTLLAYLFIPSPCISFVSFIISKPLGEKSMYLIPAAFFLTTIHHSVITCLLARKPCMVVDINSPREPRFECLRHLATICIEGFIAVIWLAGGIASLAFNISAWSKKDTPRDIASASLAIVEAGILTAITVYSWKVRREAQQAQLEISKSIPVIVVIDGESADLMERAAKSVRAARRGGSLKDMKKHPRSDMRHLAALRRPTTTYQFESDPTSRSNVTIVRYFEWV